MSKMVGRTVRGRTDLKLLAMRKVSQTPEEEKATPDEAMDFLSRRIPPKKGATDAGEDEDTDLSPDRNQLVEGVPNTAVLPTSCVEALETLPENVNSQDVISFGDWPTSSTIFQFPYQAPTNYIDQAAKGLLILGIHRFRITNNTMELGGPPTKDTENQNLHRVSFTGAMLNVLADGTNQAWLTGEHIHFAYQW